MKAMITVMFKEIADLLRDRRTVFIALLMGPLLAPALMIGIGTMAQKRATTQLEQALTLPVVGGEHAPNLVAWLDSQNVEVKAAPADAEAAIRNQDEDVVLVVDAAYGEDWRAGQPATVEILHDSSRQDARIPLQRLQGLLQEYAQTVGSLRLIARGVGPAVAQPLRIAPRDLSTPESRSGQVVGGMLAYFLILFAFLGGAYLVIDVTAGERERQSLEPLLATPASRGAIMSGKIAAACVFGLATLLLTLLAFKFSAQLVPKLPFKLDVSALAIAKLLIVLLPMVLIGTTLLTLISASVKSVKEAQSYMSVLMLLPVVPTVILLVNPVKAALWMFAVPFMAQNQMILRIARAETISAQEWGVYLACGLGLGALLWLVASRLYHREKLAISA